MSIENQEESQFEVVTQPSAIESLERASVDMQIATAKKYPRSIKTFLSKAETMITVTEEIAESCFYVLKRHNSRTGQDTFIEGPSVRLLELAASAFGNIRYGSRIVEEGEKFVVAQGVAHDLENNVYSSQETRRRITTKNGQRFGDDMIVVTANAACSIAKRNALNGVIPRSYINQLYEKAKLVAAGSAESMAQRAQKAFGYFNEKLGISQDRVLAFLGKSEIELVDITDLQRLTGLKTALKDAETTIEEAFPVISSVQDGLSGAEKFAAKVGAKPKPVAQPSAEPTPAATQPDQSKPPIPSPESAPEQSSPMSDKEKITIEVCDLLEAAEISTEKFLAFAKASLGATAKARNIGHLSEAELKHVRDNFEDIVKELV